jgi:hypothetical protein
MVKATEEVIKGLNEDDFKALWAFSMKRWIQTMKYGHI